MPISNKHNSGHECLEVQTIFTRVFEIWICAFIYKWNNAYAPFKRKKISNDAMKTSKMIYRFEWIHSVKKNKNFDFYHAERKI